MSIERIDAILCNSCGVYINSCSIDVIRMDEKGEKSVIKYVEDCMLCYYYKLDCPVKAIYLTRKKNYTYDGLGIALSNWC